MSIFANRQDAGRKLAAALSSLRGEDCVVLALPRGGVPVAAEVATALHAPLDLIFVRKIGAPGWPELAIGAIVDGGTPMVVRNEDVITSTGTSDAEFASVCAREKDEIERRRARYFSGRTPLDPKGRVAIVIDDGIATGATMRAALRATRTRGPRQLILAVPVAPQETLTSFVEEADRIVCLASPAPFGAVGYYYRDFAQTEDDEVVALLNANRKMLAAQV